MQFHRQPTTINGMFAGVVEVKLLQGKGLVVEDNSAARINVDLNSMAIVDDSQGSCLVVNDNIAWMRLDGLA
jgi:hypothetical protein